MLSLRVQDHVRRLEVGAVPSARTTTPGVMEPGLKNQPRTIIIWLVKRAIEWGVPVAFLRHIP